MTTGSHPASEPAVSPSPLATDRFHAEDAVWSNEERYRLLVDSVRDYAIFLLDVGGHVASWNPGAERIKGYRPEEILGQHFSASTRARRSSAARPRWSWRSR